MPRKPKPYEKGKGINQHQIATCSKEFESGQMHLPKAAHVYCEEMTAKDCRKLAAWLIKAAEWLAFFKQAR